MTLTLLGKKKQCDDLPGVALMLSWLEVLCVLTRSALFLESI